MHLERNSHGIAWGVCGCYAYKTDCATKQKREIKNASGYMAAVTLPVVKGSGVEKPWCGEGVLRVVRKSVVVGAT